MPFDSPTFGTSFSSSIRHSKLRQQTHRIVHIEDTHGLHFVMQFVQFRHMRFVVSDKFCICFPRKCDVRASCIVRRGEKVIVPEWALLSVGSPVSKNMSHRVCRIPPSKLAFAGTCICELVACNMYLGRAPGQTAATINLKSQNRTCFGCRRLPQHFAL